MEDEGWSVVIGELAKQPFPESLRRAVVELGVALHRTELSKQRMQERIRTMMASEEESALPVGQMRNWPEYAEQEAAKVALHDARRAVEGQSKAWVAGEVGTPLPPAPVEDGQSASETVTTLPPASLKPEEVRAALLAMPEDPAEVAPRGEVRGVAVCRLGPDAWNVVCDLGRSELPRGSIDDAVAAVVREAPRVAAYYGKAVPS